MMGKMHMLLSCLRFFFLSLYQAQTTFAHKLYQCNESSADHGLELTSGDMWADEVLEHRSEAIKGSVSLLKTLQYVITAMDKNTLPLQISSHPQNVSVNVIWEYTVGIN